MASCGTSNIPFVKMLKQIGFTEDEYRKVLQKHFIIFFILFISFFTYLICVTDNYASH